MARAGAAVPVGFGGSVADGGRGAHHDLRRAPRVASSSGIGRRMLVALIESARALGAARMTLEVRDGQRRRAAPLRRARASLMPGCRVAYYTDASASNASAYSSQKIYPAFIFG